MWCNMLSMQMADKVYSIFLRNRPRNEVPGIRFVDLGRLLRVLARRGLWRGAGDGLKKDLEGDG